MELDLFWQNLLGNVLSRHHNTKYVTRDHNEAVHLLLVSFHSKCIHPLYGNTQCIEAIWLGTVLSLEKQVVSQSFQTNPQKTTKNRDFDYFMKRFISMIIIENYHTTESMLSNVILTGRLVFIAI